jgi:predicted aspartyl protease
MEKNNAFARLFAVLGLLIIIFGFAATSAIASTPVRFKQVRNLIVTPVTVNGAGPLYFIFDTGASSTVIDLDLAKQLSLSPIESSSVLTIAGSKTVSCYRLDSLSLGPKSVRNLTVLCTELREIHAISTKIRGVLGQNFLSGFDYILNNRDQRIEFEEYGELAGGLQGMRLPVECVGGRVLIATKPSSPQKQASRLVMDSGASSVVLFKAASRNSDLEIEIDMYGGINASTIVGNQQISTGRLRKLRIGDEKFADLPARMIDNRYATQGRTETGLLPTSLFRSIYFNNTQTFVILNPRFPEQRQVAKTQ